MMNAEVKLRWLTALRSGKYQQGRGMLHRKEEDKYCCLGVLGAVEGCPLMYQTQAYLDSAFALAAGLSIHDQHRLSEKNDGGDSFETIADWIEVNL